MEPAPSTPEEIADRYRRVAGGFTDRVQAVPDEAWEQPAPCEGWVARDVVGHLVEWVPALLRGRRRAGARRWTIGR